MKKEIKLFSGEDLEVKAFDEAKLTVEHFISTERKDRGGDIVRAEGMFMTGRPVVLLEHGYGKMGREPVAKPLGIKAETYKGKKGLMAKTQFFPDETGIRLWQKTTQGFMPNWSIGFICHDSKEIDQGKGRDILKWELLEYSLVGVPMQADAQTLPPGKNVESLDFKVMPNEAMEKGFNAIERQGEAFMPIMLLDDRTERFLGIDDAGPEVKYGDGGELLDPEGKPYPNEHACRLQDPKKYKRIRRQNNKFGKGIHAIWGIKGDDTTELQSLHFALSEFTAGDAKKWCSDHDYTCRPFEAASGKGQEPQRKCPTCGKPFLPVKNTEGKEIGLVADCECTTEQKRDDPPKPPAAGPAKRAIHYEKNPLASKEATWNGNAEMTKAPEEKRPLMVAWYDAEAKEGQRKYALPHHLADEGLPVCLNGLLECAGVLMGAQGGPGIPEEDLPEVRAHIEAHFKDFGREKMPWQEIGGKVLMGIAREADIDQIELYALALFFVPEIAKHFIPESGEPGNMDNITQGMKDILAGQAENGFGEIMRAFGIRVSVEPETIPEGSQGKGENTPERFILNLEAPEDNLGPGAVKAPSAEEIKAAVGAVLRDELRAAFKKMTGKVD